jgi:hypothetical protein
MSEVWFILVDSDGQPYEDTAAGKVVVDPKADIPVLRKAIQVECTGLLDNISHLRFKIYQNRDVFDTKGKPLREDSTIAGLGISMDDALVILIPSTQKSLPATEGLTSSAHALI